MPEHTAEIHTTTAQVQKSAAIGSEPTLGAGIHAFCCLLVGLFGVVLGFLVAALSYGHLIQGSFGLGLVWSLSGLLWFTQWQRVRFRERAALYLLPASFCFCILCTWLPFFELRVFQIAVLPLLPQMLQAQLLLLLCSAGCVCWAMIALTGRSIATSWSRWRIAFITSFAIATPFISFFWAPQKIESSAREQAQSLKNAYSIEDIPLVFGAVATYVLGSELGSDAAQAERFFESHLAELESFHLCGVKNVRVDAIYDAWAAQGTGARDTVYAERYVRQLREYGMRLILCDGYSKQAVAYREPLHLFMDRQHERMHFFLEKFKPDALILTNKPLSYYRTRNIVDPRNKAISPREWGEHIEAQLKHWLIHTQRLAAKLKLEEPTLKTGIIVQPWLPEERRFYQLMLDVPEIDIVGIEAFALVELHNVVTIFKELNILWPYQKGKHCWLLSTSLGTGLLECVYAPNWQAGVLGWSQKNGVDGVFYRANGQFVPEGNGLALSQGSLSTLWDNSGKKVSTTGHSWQTLTQRLQRDWTAGNPFVARETPEERPEDPKVEEQPAPRKSPRAGPGAPQS